MRIEMDLDLESLKNYPNPEYLTNIQIEGIDNEGDLRKLSTTAPDSNLQWRNKPITLILPELTHLEFGRMYSHTIDFVNQFPKLSFLKIENYLQLPVSIFNSCPLLKTLGLSGDCKELPIDLLDSLESLQLSHEFNSVIPIDRLPKSLKSLNFGYSFSSELISVSLSHSLTSITFGEGHEETLKVNQLETLIKEIDSGYLGYRDISIYDKIKFKDIDSLTWMIEKQLFELIKCKLRANEYMEISIQSMFQLFDIKRPDSLTIQKEILELLAEKKRLELFDIDLLSIALNNCEYTHPTYDKKYINSEPRDTKIVGLVLSIFKDDIEVNDSTLKWSLINSSPETVELLIGFTNFKLSETIQKSSFIFDANSNRRYKEQMIKLVLNSVALFDSNSLPPPFCELDALFSFEDKEVVDKLLDLRLFKQSKKYTDLYGDQIEEIIKDNQQVDKIKEIHRLYSDRTATHYTSFIKKYGEIEDEENEETIDQQSTTTTIITTTSKNDTKEIVKGYIGHDVRVELLSSKSREEFESLFKCLSPTNPHKISYPSSWSPVLIALQTWNMNGSKILFNDKEVIDWVFEHVSNEMLLKSKLKAYQHREIFQFETLELIEYAKLKSITSKNNRFLSFAVIPKGSNFEKYVYQYTYLRAIENCDIETIKFIDQNVKGVLNEYLSSYRNFSKLVFKGQDESDFQNLYSTLDYLNSTGYENFTTSYFKFFVESIFEIDNTNFDFSKVSINFNGHHKKTSMSMLLDLFHDKKIYYKMNTKGILFYLRNSGDFIKLNQKELLKTISKSGFYDLYNLYHMYNNYEGDYYYEYEDDQDDDGSLNEKEIEFTNSNYSFDDLISLIEEFGKLDGDGNSDSIIHRNEIINHLYSSLIQIQGISLEDVNHAREIIINRLSIPIDHTIFHLVHYISIKSQKLLKYILDQPFLSSVLVSESEDKYKTNEEYDEFDGYNIGKLLNPFEFHFDYIFNNGTSFDQLLIKLIQNLSHGPAKSSEILLNENNFQFKSYNQNLEYLLCIKREDLFFKELEYIEMELSNKQLNGFNPTDLVYEYALFQMDTISFEKLVIFNSYKPFIHYITSPKSAKSISNKTFGYLLNHSELINQVVESQSIKFGNYDIWKKVSSEYDIIKTIIKFDLFSKEFKLVTPDHNLEFLKVIETGLSKYNIVLHQLLLKSFPNHPLLTITTSFIDTAVQFKRFNFLKYNYQNGYFKNDPSLLLHLKTKLSNQNINWLI